MNEKNIESRDELESQEVKKNNSVLIDFLKDLVEIGERMKEDEKV